MFNRNQKSEGGEEWIGPPHQNLEMALPFSKLKMNIYIFLIVSYHGCSNQCSQLNLQPITPANKCYGCAISAVAQST